MQYKRTDTIVNAVRWMENPTTGGGQWSESPSWLTTAIRNAAIASLTRVCIVQTANDYEILRFGDYLVKYGDGTLAVWSQQDFEGTYSPY